MVTDICGLGGVGDKAEGTKPVSNHLPWAGSEDAFWQLLHFINYIEIGCVPQNLDSQHGQCVILLLHCKVTEADNSILLFIYSGSSYQF